MNVRMIDKNFEYKPYDLPVVRATVDITCSTNDEMNFIFHHLESFNIEKEYNEYKKHLENQPDIEADLSKKILENLSKHMQKSIEPEKPIDDIMEVAISSNPISSLELD